MTSRWISILLVLLLTAGCGSPSVISDPKNVQKLNEQDKTVITFWNTYSDKEAWLLEEKLIPAFEREHPDIRIESRNLIFNNELKNTLIARTTSDRGPDVVRLNLSWVPEFSHKGLIVPLNGFPGFTDTISRFDPYLRDVGLYKNEYYSLPLNLYTKAAIFNRKLLMEAGYESPPRTMEEVLQIARRHRYTIGMEGFWGWHSLSYLYSLGGALTDENHTRASGYLNGEGSVHAVEQLKALYQEKLLVLSTKSTTGELWPSVLDGDMLMTDDGPWFYSLLDKDELDQAQRLTIPVVFPHHNESSSIVGGENLVIMKGSKRQAEAWTFMKWMTSKEVQLVMSQTGLIPTNRAAAKSLSFDPNSYLYPYAKGISKRFLWAPVKNWAPIDEVYHSYMKRIIEGKLPVREGLDEAARQIDRLLADSN